MQGLRTRLLSNVGNTLRRRNPLAQGRLKKGFRMVLTSPHFPGKATKDFPGKEFRPGLDLSSGPPNAVDYSFCCI